MVFQGRTKELVDILTEQMETAAENLKFEQAARLRDQIRGLERLSADQKVALPDDTVSRDAIALAADDKHACVQIFQVRAGRLVGRLGFTADAESAAPGEILQRVLESHYQTVDAVEIPSVILSQHELPEGDILAEYLTQRRGAKFPLKCPSARPKPTWSKWWSATPSTNWPAPRLPPTATCRPCKTWPSPWTLPDLPKRIEGYDISHIQGSDAVASQVVFVDGMPAKQHYRHYKIKNPEVRAGHSDDFASMAEVIRRRFRRYAADPDKPRIGNPDWPDLVMIDGGKGQLSAVVEVLREMNLLQDLNVISLAKKREEIFLPGESQPLDTEPDQPGVQFCVACGTKPTALPSAFHRKKRTDRMRRSRLSEIPGLGQHRQKELLAAFRSIDYIREASPNNWPRCRALGPSWPNKFTSISIPRQKRWRSQLKSSQPSEIWLLAVSDGQSEIEVSRQKSVDGDYQ
jgi:excinuclease ABC subunit C